MVNFAINYSKEVKKLITDHQIQPDLIKCPDWVDLVSEAAAIHDTYIHFDIKLGSKKFQNLDWEEINRFLSLTHTQYINAHLSFPKTDHLPQYQYQIEKDLDLLCTKFGEDRVIIENPPLSRSKQPFQYIAAAPKIFSDLITKFNCGFLLDISHAQRTALILEMDYKEMFAAFPLHKLVEIHMTGLKEVDGEKMDHYEMNADAWEVFKSTLNALTTNKYPQPHIIAFEYGGFGPIFEYRSEIDNIRQQVPIFMEIIKEFYG